MTLPVGGRPPATESPVSRTETTTVRSFCPLDCPDACSLEVQVADGRLVALEGDRRNPVTQGFICTKVRHFPERVHGPHRLLHPGIREGEKGEGRFRRASWDEALDLVARRMEAARDAHGGEAVLPFCYGGSNGLLTQDAADARLFRRFGASRLARTVCAAPSGRAAAGLYGAMPGVAYPDYAEARLIVLWGANPSVSHIHMVPYIREARRRGARLVVVDPRRIPLARGADLHLAVRPGGDLPLALAVIRWLFENGEADLELLAARATGVEELRRRAAPWTPERAAEASGVEAADVERFARLYAASAPALVRCGWGLERNRNGGSAVAAVLALPAVAGKLGVRGGGFTLANSSGWKLSTAAAVAAPPPDTRTINMNHLGRVLLEADDPPVEVLFVYNCNPLATMPDQERVRRGLARPDLFTVVFDPVRTDTACYADVVLPATTFLEHRELARGYGAIALLQSDPAIPPVGEARSNHRVFLDLCRRLGLERPGDAQGEDDLVRAALEAQGEAPDLAASLDGSGIAFPPWGDRPVQLVDVHPATPDGKIRLCPEELDREAAGGLYHYRPDPGGEGHPLALVSPATRRTISSSLGERHRAQEALEIHPDDAAARGIGDGDAVRVHNELGEVRCTARLNDDLKPGVVFLPKGLWSHNTANGATANALVPDTLSDLAGGACFNDARVEVERLLSR